MRFKPSKNPDVFNAVDNFRKALRTKLLPYIQGAKSPEQMLNIKGFK